MKPKSLAAPLLLIGAGVILLLRNLWPEIPLFEILTRYWPLVLVVWGTIRLIEVLWWHFSGRALPASSVSPGEWAVVILLCLLGSGLFWGYHSYWKHWPGGRITIRGIEIFGESYDTPIQVEQPSPSKTPKVILELGRGTARIVGVDSQSFKITGRKTIRALNQADAQKADQATPLEITPRGDQIFVRTNLERVDSSQRPSVDLEVSLPKGASLEARARSADLDVTDLSGAVEVYSDQADVRVKNIGSLKVEFSRSNVVRATGVRGAVEIKARSRGRDVELESVSGPVKVTGPYSGELSFREVASPLRFKTPETEFSAEKIAGSLRVDLSNITAENATGPIRLTSKSRDVAVSEFSQSLDLTVERGDLEIRPGARFGRIEARTGNGNIDFFAPPGASFEILATTDRGRIENYFGGGFKVTERGRGSELRGATGSGPTVTLQTDRGAINILKSTSSQPSPQLLPKTISAPDPAHNPPPAPNGKP